MAGDVIVREGDAGDRCYLVVEGEIALAKLAGWQMAMGPGGFFGELALLRDAPRNATAVAASDGLLLALERADFLAVVTGHARTREAAEALVAERLRSHGSESRLDRRSNGRGEGGSAPHELAEGGRREHDEA